LDLDLAKSNKDFKAPNPWISNDFKNKVFTNPSVENN
jgi:hypothetical protein